MKAFLLRKATVNFVTSCFHLTSTEETVFPKIHCITLQGAAQCSRAEMLRTHYYLCPVTLAAVIPWLSQRGLLFACCTQPLLSEVGELNTATQVRLDQGFSAAAAQLEHLPQPKWGDGKERVGQLHCPQFGVRKTDVEAIEPFRWWGKNTWARGSLHLPCLPCSLHPETPPPQNTLLPSPRTKGSLRPVPSMP